MGQKKKKKKKNKQIYDYSQAFNPFVKRIKKLRNHIAEHQLYYGWEGDVAHMDHFLLLYKYWDSNTAWEWGHSFEYEDWIFTLMMNLLRDNLRRWWD